MGSKTGPLIRGMLTSLAVYSVQFRWSTTPVLIHNHMDCTNEKNGTRLVGRPLTRCYRPRSRPGGVPPRSRSWFPSSRHRASLQLRPSRGAFSSIRRTGPETDRRPSVRSSSRTGPMARCPRSRRRNGRPSRPLAGGERRRVPGITGEREGDPGGSFES